MGASVIAAAVASTLLLGSAALLVRKRRASAAFDPPSTDAMSLEGETLYRHVLDVDPTWADQQRAGQPVELAQRACENAIGAALTAASAGGVLLVVQDPSDPTHRVWTGLARGQADGAKLPSNIALSDIVAVAGVAIPAPVDEPSLDLGLNADELWAVSLAWRAENDPQRLEGFASTFDVDFPVTSGLLHSKARLEDLARQTNAVVGAVRLARRHRAGMINESAYGIAGVSEGSGGIRVGFDLDFVGDAAKGVVHALGDAAGAIGGTASDLWDKYGGVVEVMGGWVPGPQIWVAETIVKAAKAIENNENVGRALSSQMVRFADGLRQAAPLIAYVPGIGQGVSVMLESAAILSLCALGQGCPDLSQAAIELAASQVPGGPITQGAFRSAATAGYDVAQGKAWDEASLDALRVNLPSDEAKVAFDAGLALARGSSLQEAGFQALRALARGNSLAEEGVDYAQAIAEAAEQGKDVKKVLVEHLVTDVRALRMADLELRNELGSAISDLQANPELLQGFPADAAEALGYAEPIARAAMSAVQDLGNGVIVVDPDVTRALFPQITASNAALLQANSSFRTERMNLTDPSHLSARMMSFASDNGLVSQAVQDQAARAKRTIDRLNWVTWYKSAYAQGLFG